MLQPIVNSMPLLEYIYRRCLQSKEADLVAVITSVHCSDDQINDYCIKHGIKIFRGDLDNVLKRYCSAAVFFQSEIICRVCGDSPFVDIQLIDTMFRMQKEGQFDYVAPQKSTFIAGFDSEIISTAALERINKAETSDEEAEHVTLYLKKNQDKFKTKFINVDMRPKELMGVSLTVDYPRDLVFCQKVVELLRDALVYNSKEVLDVLLKNKNVSYVS